MTDTWIAAAALGFNVMTFFSIAGFLLKLENRLTRLETLVLKSTQP